MYTYEQIMKAVKFYIKYAHRSSQAQRELGYPCRYMLIQWFHEYEASGDLHQDINKKPKYSESEKQAVLQYYHEMETALLGPFKLSDIRAKLHLRSG